jgi:glutamate-ammonia-ligase adenylyltransferase
MPDTSTPDSPAAPAWLAELPPSLQREAQLAWNAIATSGDEAAQQRNAALLADDTFARRLATLLACGPFAAQLCRRFPDWLPDLHAAGDLDRGFDATEWAGRLAHMAGQPTTPEALDQALRRFRNREFLRIVWRDFNRIAPTLETTADISAVAECCVQAALDFHYAQLCREWGTPLDTRQAPQSLVVLGMGKLGAAELNLSSDIDLSFAYPAAGETAGGPASVSNQEFFVRLGQRVIKSLDQITADGFVFRVDMRLRPYGDSGALVLNFDAMEEYYQTQGRDWERYAMIKARPWVW